MRHNITVPEEIYERLLILAGDFGYKYKLQPCVIRLLDAVSQLLPEDLEPLLNEAELLPNQTPYKGCY